MIRPSFLPLLLAAGLGLTVAAPALAKEKPAAEDAAAEPKADKKKPAKSEAKKPETKKPDAAKKPADAKKTAEAKKPADAKKAAAADESEEPDAKPAKDKNGKPVKGGKDHAGKDSGGKDAKSAGKEKPAEKEKPGAKTPTAIGSYGDWNAMTAHGQGKDKTCYALAEPKDRQPAKLQRDKAYVFISTRPGEGVRNEVAIILGFAAKDGGAASADIDGDNFELVTKGSNAWVKNPAKEKEFVEALKSGTKLVVKAPSAKGNVTTDSYSLKGLSDALGRVQKECP
ncbi:invasion associated locus B family protein [Methylosinus sp. LW4]|uniref:invasion associated locus B family protein n=1 Tax=Methylosinus sp. LW4 TaxID=136993 RepID=UPI000361EFB3|nr:invasion associated locus B family protein [Methylosinus sp. LW4]